jgi:hypothetical protein
MLSVIDGGIIKVGVAMKKLIKNFLRVEEYEV